MTPALRIEQLRKIYATSDGRTGGGVQSATFDIAQGELFTLLGPSGCGKTTTLRAIAGLEAPDSGRIEISGREVFNSQSGKNVALHDRGIGMVFQSYAIWPHMTVFENAAYPLRVSRGRRYSHKEIAAKTSAVLDRVGLGAFAARPATQLSGGQQQRLALARALAREPRLLLLDEPLSNLDAQLREQMRLELKRLQQETGVTAIYVTHDQSEALAISDRIAVMRNGKIVQIGEPKDIYQRPASEFVANFVGRSNLFRGTVAEAERNVVQTPCGAFTCHLPCALPAGANASVLVRPECVSISKADEALPPRSGETRLAGNIVRAVYLGEAVEYLVSVDGADILVRASSAPAYEIREQVALTISGEHAIAVL